MCLDTIDEVIQWKTGVGYKLFYNQSSYGPSRMMTGYSRVNRMEARLDKWLHDEGAAGGLINTTYSSKYPAGFHLNKTKAGAERLRIELNWNTAVIREVKFKNVVATGLQSGTVCIVARSIMLLADKEAK